MFSIRSAFFCAVFIVCSTVSRADLTLTYSVGNSLTYDIQYAAGLDGLSVGEASALSSGYHIRCARPLSYIVQNPTDVCVDSPRFGTYQTAFSSTALQVVTLQPFYGASIRSEVEAAKQLVQELRANPANASTRILIYATWAANTAAEPFLSTWNRQDFTLDSNFVPSAKAYDLFMNEFRLDVPDAEIIPAGHVFAQFANDLQAHGQVHGLTSVSQIYRDDIHGGNIGRYFAAATAYSTIYGKSSEGLGVPSAFQLTGNNGLQLTPELTLYGQQTSWNVVQSITGVPEPTSLAMAAFAACSGGLMMYRRRRSAGV